MSTTVNVPVSMQGDVCMKGNLKWNRSFEAEISAASDAIGKAKLKAAYDESLGRYVCSAIELERAGEGFDLTGAVLRDVRVAEVMQFASLHNIWVDSVLADSSSPIKVDGEPHISAADALTKLRPVAGRTTDADAANATIAFSIAQVAGLPPLKTIGEALKTSQSTAKRLVARARELGYIDG